MRRCGRSVYVRSICFVLFFVGAIVALTMYASDHMEKGAAEGAKRVAQLVDDEIVKKIRKQMNGEFKNVRDAHEQIAAKLNENNVLIIEAHDASRLHQLSGDSRNWCTKVLADQCKKTPMVSGFYIGNEYGHFCSFSCKPDADGHHRISTSPPWDQIRKDVPTWTIPCQYRKDCSSKYTANGNARLAKYCQPEGVFDGLEECHCQYDDCKPEFARSKENDPEWLRGIDRTFYDKTPCIPNLPDPTAGCGRNCSLVLRQYYTVDDEYWYACTVPDKRTLFDCLARPWYQPCRESSCPKIFITGIYKCFTTGQPCFSVSYPLRKKVPAVNSIVVYNSERCVVKEHVKGTAGTDEMYMLRLGCRRGDEPIVSASKVRLARSDPEVKCTDPNRKLDCISACERDAALPGIEMGAGTHKRQHYEEVLVGVAIADFETVNIQDLTDSFKVGQASCTHQPSGVFIMSRKDLGIFAAASELGCDKDAIKHGETELLNCSVAAAIAQVRLDPYQTNQTQQVYFEYEGHAYRAHVIPITLSEVGISGVDWLLGVIVPQDMHICDATQTREEYENRAGYMISALIVSLAVLALALVTHVNDRVAYIRQSLEEGGHVLPENSRMDRYLQLASSLFQSMFPCLKFEETRNTEELVALFKQRTASIPSAEESPTKAATQGQPNPLKRTATAATPDSGTGGSHQRTSPSSHPVYSPDRRSTEAPNVDDADTRSADYYYPYGAEDDTGVQGRPAGAAAPAAPPPGPVSPDQRGPGLGSDGVQEPGIQTQQSTSADRSIHIRGGPATNSDIPVTYASSSSR